MTPPAARDKVGHIEAKFRIFFQRFYVMNFCSNTGTLGRCSELA
jgi:hypothetical protein